MTVPPDTSDRLGAGVADLAVAGLHAGYGATTVLHGVSLTVPNGEVVALLGANGAGKTTLLRSVCGRARVSSGTVRFGSFDLTGLSPHEVASRGVCYVPEGRAIFRSLTVFENLEVYAAGRLDPAAVERVYGMFPRLRARSNQLAGTLSGGEQQMLALSRPFIVDAGLVLVDEPSMGLAPVIVDEVFDALGQLKAAGTTVLLVEQYVERALALADTVYVMGRGAVTFSGEPHELLASSDLMSAYLGANTSPAPPHATTALGRRTRQRRE